MDSIQEGFDPRKNYEDKHTKNRRRRKTMRSSVIEHHHLLIRMETRKCPLESDKDFVAGLVKKIIRDIGMKELDEPRIYYVTHPRYNEGLTAIVPIQTSHIAFHFWTRAPSNVMRSKEGRCLLEFDVYTCGKLSRNSVKKILTALEIYEPTEVDIDVLNRKYSLKIVAQHRWCEDNSRRVFNQFVRDL